MGNGFKLGGLARGFNSQLEAGSARSARKEQSKLGQQRLAFDQEKEQADQEAARQKMKKEAADSGKTEIESYTTGFEAAINNGTLKEENFGAALNSPNFNKRLAIAGQLTGEDPANIKAEMRRRMSLARSQKVKAEQEAAAAALKATETEKAMGDDDVLKSTGKQAAAKQGDTVTKRLLVEADEAVKAGRLEDATVLREAAQKVGRTVFDRPAPGAASAIAAQTKLLVDTEISGRNSYNLIDRMIEQVADKDVTTGLASGTLTFLSDASGFLVQLGRVAGHDDAAAITEAENSKEVRDTIASWFPKQAAESSAFRSNAIRLAYAMARSADPGGRIAKDDFINNINQLGTSRGDKTVVARTLREVKRNIGTAVRNTFTTIHRHAPEGSNYPQIPDMFKETDGKPGTAKDDVKIGEIINQDNKRWRRTGPGPKDWELVP